MNQILNSVGVADPPASPEKQPTNSTASPESGRGARGGGAVAWLGRTLPTLIVLAALGALGYWGHESGWKLPKFSELNGTAHSETGDWCREHDVPESICVECKPELLAKAKDFSFCKQHGVHQCPLCHPETAQLKDVPKVSQADLERVQGALELMDRPENNPKCPLYRRRIQFASAEAVAKAGVDVDLVEQRPVVEAITANGEITYDQTRVARLSSRAPGAVWRVQKQVGDPVKQGEVLVLVDAAEVGRLKAELLAGLAEENLQGKAYARAQSLEQKGIVASKQAQEAQTELGKARIRVLSARQALANLGLIVSSLDDLHGVTEAELASRLRFLGLPEEVTSGMDSAAGTSSLLPVTSRIDGVVVTRDAVEGDVVDTSKPLFVVADVSRMSLTLDVRQEDGKYLALGQTVRFRTGGATAEATGKVAWISTAVDEKTRTLKVRADIPNPEGRLRAGMFGAGRIVLREEPNAVAVPNEAVHWDGSCHAVFVRDKHFLDEGGAKVFHTRTVRPGVKDDRYTEIIAGLLPGEVVASKGSGILRASLLKNNLGAG